MRPADITIEEWVSLIFDPSTPEKWWHSDLCNRYWDGAPAAIVDLTTRTFENAGELLAPFSDAQVNDGLYNLIHVAYSDYIYALYDDFVPRAARERCILSIETLFVQYFAHRCTPHLSHLNQGGSPLNAVCYMWWELFPEPSPDPWDGLSVFAYRRVMARTLYLDAPACIESALHGLGHARQGGDHTVESIIDAFLAARPNSPPALRAYAERARAGRIQ